MEKIFEDKEFHGEVSFFKNVIIRLGSLVINALTMVGAFILTGDLTMTGNLDVTGTAEVSGNITTQGFVINDTLHTANAIVANPPLIGDLQDAFSGNDTPDGFVGILKDSSSSRRFLCTRDYAGTWSTVALVNSAVS